MTTRHLSVAHAEPVNRGRLLYVDDVIILLGKKKSAWWVRRHVAPSRILKIGRDVAWWEADVMAWIAAQSKGAA